MTRNQAQRLKDDLGKSLTDDDFVENIYISIKNVGTKVFKQCAYHETDGYTFIWTRAESYIMDKKDMGDFVVIPYEHRTHTSLNKVI